MNPQRRQAVLVGVMMVMLAVAAAWNLGWMVEQKERAVYAASELAATRQLVRDIERLQAIPAVATSQELQTHELGARIEAARQAAGLPDDWQPGVQPQPAQSVPRTPYVQKPTALTLASMSLPQLTTFLACLTQDSNLVVRDLRLRTPRGGGEGDRWDATATVVYLMYSPSERTSP